MNNWERHIKHAWRERIIPDASLEFFLVTPLPEDAAASTLGQLMIVQRAVRFQRSVLISLYGNGYDRGLPHSHAFVMSDRVDLHNVRSLVEAVDDCPPEQPSNVCTLWLVTGLWNLKNEFYSRHGLAFRFFIHRRRADDQADSVDFVVIYNSVIELLACGVPHRWHSISITWSAVLIGSMNFKDILMIWQLLNAGMKDVLLTFKHGISMAAVHCDAPHHAWFGFGPMHLHGCLCSPLLGQITLILDCVQSSSGLILDQ